MGAYSNWEADYEREQAYRDEVRADVEDWQRERDEARADDFRCPGCEIPTKDGRYCAECRNEAADYWRDDD